MDPLRCGAGEAGAFHPLYEAWQTIRAKTNSASVSLCAVRDTGGVSAAVFHLVLLSRNAENIGERGGLNSLSGHASLKIPLRLVSRPAQEERDECTSLKNLLTIT
jgi:hypothetical protein